jgi:hypothetical protein
MWLSNASNLNINTEIREVHSLGGAATHIFITFLEEGLKFVLKVGANSLSIRHAKQTWLVVLRFRPHKRDNLLF